MAEKSPKPEHSGEAALRQGVVRRVMEARR